MPRSRPANAPISFHKHTGQYYVTRAGKRVYLGADRDAAMDRYHRLALGLPEPQQPTRTLLLSAKQLANRFLAAQEANWRNANTTLRCYRDWLRRFLEDHPGFLAEDLTVEMFAAWKLSLRGREYSPRSINHYLGAVRAMYAFGEDTGLLDRSPRLKRVKNESLARANSANKALYTVDELKALLACADLQLPHDERSLRDLYVTLLRRTPRVRRKRTCWTTMWSSKWTGYRAHLTGPCSRKP